MKQVSEERIRQYIESVQAGYMPEEKTWWQHSPPVYKLTKDYAGKLVDTSEPAVFKRVKKEWMIASVMVIVASVLLYLLSKKEFGFIQLIILSLLLLVLLPRLLENKTMIRVGPESIWLSAGDKEIAWGSIILTYIKEVQEESISYFLIVHYYDEQSDNFSSIEMELKGIAEPSQLAAAIEAFRGSPQKDL